MSQADDRKTNGSGPEEETLLEFPCSFPIKAMGKTADDFEALVVSLIREHAELDGEDAVSCNQSSEGRFTSVTVVVTATSKAQLDAIYFSLTDHERVLMAL